MDNGSEAQDEQENFVLGTAGTIEVCMLVFIFVIGGTLNSLAFVSSVKAFRRQKHKSQILLLRINLNIADLITVFIYVSRQIIWMLTFQWYGGDILCRVNSFFSTFSFYLNSFVIVTIAIDRVFGAYNISSINAHHSAYRRCFKLLLIGWIAAFILSTPQVFIFRVYNPFPDFIQCVPLWTVIAYESHQILYFNETVPIEVKNEIYSDLVGIQKMEHWYNVAHLLFVFWIPCLIVIFCYLTVVIILKNHLRTKDSSTSLFARCIGRKPMNKKIEQEQHSPQTSSLLMAEDYALRVKDDMREAHSNVSDSSRSAAKFGHAAVITIHKAKEHAKKQATWIIIAYLTLWTPYNVIALLNMFKSSFQLPFPISMFNALICANSIVNPIIYGIFSKSK